MDGRLDVWLGKGGFLCIVLFVFHVFCESLLGLLDFLTLLCGSQHPKLGFNIEGSTPHTLSLVGLI